jgi:replication initiation and membrane attachment protein DnaB
MECKNNQNHWWSVDILANKHNNSNNAAHSQEQPKWVTLNKVAKASEECTKAEFEQIEEKRRHNSAGIVWTQNYAALSLNSA